MKEKKIKKEEKEEINENEKVKKNIEIESEYKEEKVSNDEDKKDKKIEELEKKLEEANDKYLYALAEMKDLHKNYQSDNFRSIGYFKKDLILDLLPILDIFETVLENKNVSKELSAYLKGFEIILNQFRHFFEKNNVKEIKSKEKMDFDHNLHNAVEKIEIEDKKLDSKIKEVLQKGYTIDGKLLRPASVVVYKYAEEDVESKEDKKEEESKKVIKNKNKGGDLND